MDMQSHILSIPLWLDIFSLLSGTKVNAYVSVVKMNVRPSHATATYLFAMSTFLLVKN